LALVLFEIKLMHRPRPLSLTMLGKVTGFWEVPVGLHGSSLAIGQCSQKAQKGTLIKLILKARGKVV
jgi:hypothetical protein